MGSSGGGIRIRGDGVCPLRSAGGVRARGGRMTGALEIGATPDWQFTGLAMNLGGRTLVCPTADPE